MEDYPLVSIVTPVFNMASYVEETIQSVLSQDYPRIEYIVMDGASTDGTMDVVKKYEGRLRVHSAPDGGAADAVNCGYRMSNGSVFAYLNADDTYLPGAISSAVRHLAANPDAGGVYGEANWVADDGTVLGRYPTHSFDPVHFARECYICQAASFVRREAFERSGLLDARLHYTFDYDFWIRMSKYYRLHRIGEFLATSRMHSSNKTLGERGKVLKETASLLQAHFSYVPFSWVYAYACYLVDKRDQFFEPLVPSIPKYVLSLLMGF